MHILEQDIKFPLPHKYIGLIGIVDYGKDHMYPDQHTALGGFQASLLGETYRI